MQNWNGTNVGFVHTVSVHALFIRPTGQPLLNKVKRLITFLPTYPFCSYIQLSWTRVKTLCLHIKIAKNRDEILV